MSRPSWLDPRIIGGLVLVIAAVVIGARVIGSSQHTTAVLSAAHDLAEGTVLAAGDVVPVEVNLGDGTGKYLSADSVVAGRALQQPIRSGELVPVGALGDPLTGRVLVIPVAAERMPPGVGHGAVVDVYLITGDGEQAVTAPLVQQVTVQSVSSPSSGGLSGAGSSQYQMAVLLPAEQADQVVRKLPTGAALVVLVSGPAR
jgi:hypothetical protein